MNVIIEFLLLLFAESHENGPRLRVACSDFERLTRALLLQPHGLVQEISIKNRHGRHRFNDGYGSRKYAWIVASFRVDRCRCAMNVDRRLGLKQCGNWFKGHAERDGLAVADASLNASGFVGYRVEPHRRSPRHIQSPWRH